jgi:conjugative transfer region protein TrbK
MMSFRIVIRGVAYVVLAVALLATAIALNNRQYRPAGTFQAEPSSATDNLDVELARCKALGTEAANDAGCKAIWQAYRDGFLNSKKLYQERVANPPTATLNPNQPAAASGGQLPTHAPVPANRAGQPQ